MIKFFAGCLLFTTLFACTNNSYNYPKSTEDSVSKEKKDSLMMTEKNYGQIDGKEVIEYTISNSKGMQVSILNYGGTVTNLITPDKNGVAGNVVLGYNSLEGFRQKVNPYF